MFVPDDGKKIKKSFLEERAKNREDRELHRKKNDSAIRHRVENFDDYYVIEVENYVINVLVGGCSVSETGC